ncbi:iron-containing alcohol dehydrogenase [Selenomonas ruminantium]|uniref:Alcohol dehydrogenase n=1 Tax=Selenomonas ruminantium TaxID=971 RepID=A0A1I0YKA8_SELRU|nr:iron-containing alcohol dehydrogenase [Selenomonas ruminantium]SFB13764.1 alcohol dehydrogenase [Selenomonas ruminantium]
MNFTWEVPTRIHFGTHICEGALAAERNCLKGCKALLVYTGHTLRENDTLAKLQGLLQENGCTEVLTYGGHGANPEISEAEAAGKQILKHGVNLIVALGGGSAIDLAKGAAVAAASNISLRDHLVKGIPAPSAILPLIALPTTAGTGSELSKGAILSDRELKIKGGIRGKSLAPKIAIVDASFTWSMPEKLTMETGFDALAHAIESYLSRKANLHSEQLSLQAIRLIGENLPKLKRDLSDREAREKMSYASMLMGMNLYNVGNCLPHRMQYPIGAATGTSHAMGLAALYPVWIKEEYRACPDKVMNVFRYLLNRTPHSAQEAEELMANFLMELGLCVSLEELGVKEGEIAAMVEKISGDISVDPAGGEDGICSKLYIAAM